MNEHQSATTGWFIGGLIGLLIIATCFVLLHRDYEEDNKKTVLIYKKCLRKMTPFKVSYE